MPPKKKVAVSRRGGGKLDATALNNLLGRSRFMQRLAGIQYGGNRDIYKVAGYPAQDKITFGHFWGLFTRGDVAGRIVDMPAKTTWRTPPEVSEADKPDGTPFTKAFTELAKRLRLWQYFARVDRVAGIGRYGVLMIGTSGVTDQELKTPLERVTGPDQLIYLSVYHEGNAEIVDWETDPGNKRFGLPKTYRLKISSSESRAFVTGSGELLVHASRVLHVAEDVLEDDVYGRPRLERAFNRLFDLDKVAASTGEAYWQLASRILQAKVDPSAEITATQLKELDEKLGELTHDLKRQFYGQGVELGWLESTPPNVQQVADFYFSLIAGASGIPKRILFGSELGELASTTDQATYVGMINERQEQFAEPMILRAFIDKMIEIKALPRPKDGEYQIIWPALFEESDTARADASLKRAQTAAALTPVGGDPRELVEIDEEGNVWLIPRDANPEGALDNTLIDEAAADDLADVPVDEALPTGDSGPTGPTGPAGE